MKQALILTRKELHSYFGSPMALIFVGVFLAATLFTFFWVDDLKQAAHCLLNKLHNLDDVCLATIPPGAQSVADVLAALAAEPLVEQWFAYKKDSVTAYVRALCQGVKEINAHLQMGIGARLPAFAPMTGYDLPRLAPLADFVLPKIYQIGRAHV